MFALLNIPFGVCFCWCNIHFCWKGSGKRGREKERKVLLWYAGGGDWYLIKVQNVSFFYYLYLHWCFLDSCLQSKFRSEKIGYSVVGKCQCCIKYARTDNKGSIISCFHPYLLLLSRGQTGKKILPFTKLVKYWLVVNLLCLRNPEAVWGLDGEFLLPRNFLELITGQCEKVLQNISNFMLMAGRFTETELRHAGSCVPTWGKLFCFKRPIF